MVRTEALQAIESLIKTLLVAKKRGKSLHGAVFGPWGAGKTNAVRSLTGRYPVFYLKAPRGSLTPTRLLRLIGLSLGAGAAGTYDYTLDLIKGHLQQENASPLILIDEAQRIFSKPALLDELKDFSEDPDLGFSYLFIGDMKLKEYLARKQHHSIIKRILYKTELKGEVGEATISELLKEYNLKGDPKEVVKLLKKRKWKILELDNVLYLLQLRGLTEASEENIEKVLRVTEVVV